MIKTVPIDLILNLLVGQLIALFSYRQLQAGTVSIFNRYFLICFVYGLVVFAPIGYFLFLEHRTWSFMYFIDAEKLGAWLGIPVIFSYLYCLVIGYFFTQYLIQQKYLKLSASFIFITVLILGVYISQTYDRLLVYSTFSEFNEKNFKSVFSNKNFIIAFLIIIPYFTISLVLILYWLWKNGKKFRILNGKPRNT